MMHGRKISDRSEHGWATVAWYEEDELADNSNDKKILFQTEMRAGKRLKTKEYKYTKRRGSASRKPFRASAAGTQLPRAAVHWFWQAFKA